MQYKGSKLDFDFDLSEIKDLDWGDNVFKLPKTGPGFTEPIFHDNCPVGWKTTHVDDIARFLPQLHGLELDLAWRKFRSKDRFIMDWYPSSQRDPCNDNKFITMFPIFNFQECNMRSCIGYCGDVQQDLNLKKIELDTTCLTLQKPKTFNAHVVDFDLKPKKVHMLVDSQDPCGRIVPSLHNLQPIDIKPRCCRMMDLDLPMPIPPISPPSPPSTLPPLEPQKECDKPSGGVSNVLSMTKEDWIDVDVMAKYGYKTRPWIHLPPLNFLPCGVDTIIAGEKGYLVVDGGWQPQERIQGEYDLPMQDGWNLNKYPPQTITCVCNPLLKRFEYVHPFPHQQLQNKIARMEVKPNLEQDEEGSTMYNIYFVGYNVLSETSFLDKDKKKLPNTNSLFCRDEVVVAIYNSNVKNWIGTYSRLYVRHLCNNQSNDLALVDKKLFWVSEWADHGKKIEVQNDALDLPPFKWIPVISCFDFETKEITGFAFCQELYHKKIENCLLMECNGSLYLVSQATATNKEVPQGRFEVRLIEYRKGFSKFTFKRIGIMPKQQYDYMFGNCYMCIQHNIEPAYQCHSGLSLICFYVPSCGSGVLFDVNKCSWINMDRQCGWKLTEETKSFPPNWGKNSMASCIWEPNFKALWTKEYRGPHWDPLGDDPTGPDKWNEPTSK